MPAAFNISARGSYPMITFKEQPNTRKEIEALLHPIIKQWFFSKFQEFSLPQLYGVVDVHARKNILVSAPTGSGKTLTAMLAILNELIDSSEKGILEDKVYCVYVNPLKALSNDIEINLKTPLKEMEALAGKNLGVRIAVRTGDTTPAEKQKMLKHPPHILVCTPETLAILLSSLRFSEHLRNVQWFVEDEVHALAENKRGVHLSLSVERLQRLSPGMARIGLSATVSPLEEIAKFLVGNERNCTIVDAQFLKNVDLKVLSPVDDLVNNSYEDIEKATYALIDKLIQEHKTTLIFTNTRAATERVVHHLKTRFPHNYHSIDEETREKTSLIGAHHGSLSKEHRLQLENDLREGKLKAVVCSTSLELGIDIGYVDLVICLGSPKSVARFLQRCLPYDAKILLRDGTYRKIGDIVENRLDVEILSFHPAKGFSTSKIGQYYKHQADKLLQINLHSGLSLECTEEHPIMTREGWKKARDLQNGEEIAELFNLPFKKQSPPYIYKIISQNEYYVENRNDFLREIVDAYILKEQITYSQFANKIGIDQNHLQNYLRRNGRRKSIRLDIFLRIMKTCHISKEEYLEYLKEIKSKAFHRKPIPLQLDEDFMWFAGMVASDGALTVTPNPKDNKLKLSNKDRKLLEECQKEINKWGYYPKIRPHPAGSYTLDCGAKLLVDLCIALGIKKGKTKSLTIEVSNLLYSLPKSLVIPYIEGLMEGDGNKNNNIRIFTGSKKFAVGLHNLLNKSGIHNYFVCQEAKTSKLIQKINQDVTYCLYVGRNKHVQEFLKFCTLKGKKAKYLYAKKYYYAHQDRDIEQNIHWVKISDIATINAKNSVYNITLAKEPNSYFVDSVLTHNCGRAGHKLHDTVKGRLLVTDRDDLVECSVLLKHAIEKNIDALHIPTNCLDVLAQQILGMALEEVSDVDELYKTITQSYCYKNLSRKDFEEILDYLAGNFASLEERYIFARIWWDKDENKVGKKGRMTRIIYMTNIGTIPDHQGVLVKDPRGSKIGTIDEGFLEKLDKGDVFVLGGNTYQFNYARGMVAQVTAAPGKRPTVPSWYSDRLPLSYDLAKSIQHFRALMDERLRKKQKKEEIISFVHSYLYVDDVAAEALYNYFKDQFDYVGIPHEKKLLIEQYRDEQMKNYVVFHSLYGRRTNDALARALAYAIMRSQHKDVEIGISDNGFYISYNKNVNVKKAFELLTKKNFREVLELAIDKSEITRRRFRHCAGRALMILRTYGGQRKRVGRQQVSSTILMSAVRRISEKFFILRETRREVIEDLMDLHAALDVLTQIENKTIKIEEVVTFIPSPFALNLVMQGYSDILRMEDKQKFLQRMHQMVKAKIALKQRV